MLLQQNYSMDLLDPGQCSIREAILAGAMVAGLGVIGLFDHYLWTLAPDRIMLGLVIGLWAGQAANDAWDEIKNEYRNLWLVIGGDLGPVFRPINLPANERVH
jgi:hypothetical protein